MDETIRRLLAQDHPDFEVIISLGHDDLPTIAAAENIVDRYPERVRLSINHEDDKSKPVQLNSSLLECTKDVVGIIDAGELDRSRVCSDASIRPSGRRRPTSSRCSSPGQLAQPLVQPA